MATDNNIINQINDKSKKAEDVVNNALDSYIKNQATTVDEINKLKEKYDKEQKILNNALVIKDLYKKYKEEQDKSQIDKKQKKRLKLPKGIGGIILTLLNNSVDVNDRFNKALENILIQLSESCPQEETLTKLIKEKNNLSNALNQVYPYLQQAESIGTGLTPIINALKIIVQILKNLPLPTAVPPGIGIPANILNKFSDILIKSDKKIDQTSEIISQIVSAVAIIKTLVEETLQKITILDQLLEVCFQQITQDMSEEEKNKFKTLVTPDEAIFVFPGLYKDFIYDKETINVGLGNSMIRAYATKGNIRLEGTLFNTPSSLQLVNDIKIVIDNFLNPKTDTTSGSYRGFYYSIELNKNNKIQLPQRRAIGIKNQIALATEYSFTPNPQILIEEIKQIINDYLDKNILTNIVNPKTNSIPEASSSNSILESFTNQISNIGDTAYNYVNYNVVDLYYLDTKTKLNNGSIKLDQKLLNDLKDYEYTVEYYGYNALKQTITITFSRFDFNINNVVENSIDKNTIKKTTQINVVKQ